MQTNGFITSLKQYALNMLSLMLEGGATRLGNILPSSDTLSTCAKTDQASVQVDYTKSPAWCSIRLRRLYVFAQCLQARHAALSIPSANSPSFIFLAIRTLTLRACCL